MLEALKIIGLYPLVKGKQAIEQAKVMARFWPRLPFLRDDLRLGLTTLRQNPYRVSRRYLLEKGVADTHTYGETPLTTLAKIAKWAGLCPQDRVYDLGCGPGRTSLWLHHFIGCTVVGVERIPQFVKTARRFEKRGLSFLEADMLTLDYSRATVVYLYGTTMEDGEIGQLLQQFETLPKGAKVITVSFPLTDYAPKHYQLVDTFEVSFPWGRGDAYLQLRCC